MSPEEFTVLPLGDLDGKEEFTEKDIVVEVVDDTPEDDRGRVAPGDRSAGEHEEELTDVSKNVQKRIKKLKFDFHEERRSKEAASRLRDEAVNFAKRVQQENVSLRELVNKGEQVLMDEVKTRASNDLEAAKVQLKQAHEEGDAETLVNAQEVLSRASYESQKAQELLPVDQATTPPAQPPPPQRAQEQAPDPKAVEWGQKNPWFRTDREMTAFAIAVHENLVSSGVDIKSDDYYDKVDTKMRDRFPEKFEGEVELRSEDTPPIETVRKPPSTVVAPARRVPAGSQMQVRLTKTQVALAEKLGVSPENYAKHVLILENENG